MRIAFHAPLKPPCHPVPSGDRLMARLLVGALQSAGHEVEIATRFRSFTPVPQAEAIFAQAEIEIAALKERFGQMPAHRRPDVWFTYHPYYKAPDLVGPHLARHFGLAYVTAEASFAGKRDRDGWSALQAIVKHAVRDAAMNFCMTDLDAEGLAEIAGAERIRILPPFIDAAGLPARIETAGRRQVRLVTVAMMRPGVKLESYAMLARGLANLDRGDWSLTIVGDGSMRRETESLFAGFGPGHVTFAGQRDEAGVGAALGEADLFVWPGIGEAYGLAYLEAQACGLPVVAVASKGVPSVVEHGRTGLLSDEGDEQAFAHNLARLIGDAGLRSSMSRDAEQFARRERTVDAAAAILDQGLRDALGHCRRTA